MTGPTHFPWARDAAHPAGGDPWSGQPNKVQPPAARLEEGWHDELRPSAQHLNYLLNRLALITDRLNMAAVVNWLEAHTLGVAGGMPGANWVTGGVVDAGRVAYCGTYFAALDEDGNGIFTVDYGFPLAATNSGHVRWESETAFGNDPRTGPPAWAAGATLVDLAAMLSGGTVGVRIAVSNSAAGQLAQSPGPGAWAGIAPATGGVLWGACAVGNSGISNPWVIGGNGGQIESAASAVGPYTLRASGLAASPILCLEHNQGTGGGYSRYLALTATERSTSPNGTTWTASAHGLTSPPVAVAYSHGGAGASASRWVAILQNGTDVAYSDDQGATWTQLPGVLPSWGGGTFKKASIASDGFGVFVATMGSGTGIMMWASIDNGLTWTRVHVAPGDADSHGMGVAWGPARVDSAGFVGVGGSRAIYTPVLLPIGF